jgi:hypothetical protein
MAEQQIANLATRAAPLTRVTKDSEEFELLAVNANFDGTGAASAFLPCVEVVSDAGIVVARSVATDTVAAGDSAEVTFAPFLGRKGSSDGIRFDVPNVGGSLDVTTTSGDTTFTVESGDFDVTTDDGEIFLWSKAGGTYPQVFIDADASSSALFLGTNKTFAQVAYLTLDASVPQMLVNVTDGAGAGDVVYTVGHDFDVAVGHAFFLQIPAGGTFNVTNHLGSPIFRVDENGDLHGKTGKALVFDLP